MTNPAREPTEEQAKIIEATGQRPESLMVEAFAGCAKSTTLEMAAPQVRAPALALAFNRSTAQELVKRLPSNFQAKTFNGLGHQAWARAVPHVSRLRLETRKLGTLVTEVAKERDLNLSQEQWANLRDLVSSAMQAGITPGDQGDPLTLDREEIWRELVPELDDDEFGFLYDSAREILARDIRLGREGTISFDDQVYLSATLGGKFSRFPVVFADEAQDLSPLNHHILRKVLTASGRLVAVGDSKQAIYAFRGADSKSMKNLRELRPEWHDLRLTLTFRCPKEIVKRQQEHAPGFRAHPSNREGLFELFELFEEETEKGGWGPQELLALREQGSTVVLCRNNGPLLSLAFKLIRAQVGVHVLGRELGKGLVNLSRKIAKDDDIGRDRLEGLITEWADKEESKLRARGKEELVAGIADKRECLYAVLDSAEVRNAGELRAALEKLFAKEAGQITLSSIHKAKGLEWENVVHLDPWRIPSKFAIRAADAGDDTQLRQEFNLRYVCETRSRNRLVNANLKDYRRKGK
jgi:superfamily I DNA/RNA helicase